MRYLIFIITLLSCCVLYASPWQCYRNTGKYTQIIDFAGTTYVLAGTTLLHCQPDGSEMQTFGIEEGLSGTEVFSLVMPADSSYLAIVYTDCSIDLVRPDGSLQQLRSLYDFAVLGTDKTLRHISIVGHNLFISCNFGFVEYDPLQDLFVTACPSPTPCIRSFRYQGELYRQRETVGMERCPKGGNMYRPEDWHPVTNATAIPDFSPAVDHARLQSLPDFSEVGVSPCCLMKVSGGQLIALQSVIYHKHYHPNQIVGQISRLDIVSGQWHTTTYQTLLNQITDQPKNFCGLLQFEVDPNDPEHLFISTMGNLLFETRGDTLVRHHTPSNSPIGYWIGFEDNLYGRTGGLCWDAEGNLWFINNHVDFPICCLTPSGQWHQFKFDKIYQSEYSPTLIFSQNNRLLWGLDEHKLIEIYVYDTNQTPFDSSDDTGYACPLADEHGNPLKKRNISTLAEDHEGRIWILTTAGIRLIEDQTAYLADPSHATTRPLLEKVNANDGDTYLLDGVDCQCIVIDPQDRKWIGTIDDGLYLTSPDGSRILAHYTTSNSPLYTNGIYALAYDSATSLLFISSDNGILSLDTREAGNDSIDITSLPTDFSQVSLSMTLIPTLNSDPLIISHLPAETTLLITDSAMQTVFKTQVTNGEFQWDLVTEQGEYLPAGAYNIYASTPSLALRYIATITREASNVPTPTVQSGK